MIGVGLDVVTIKLELSEGLASACWMWQCSLVVTGFGVQAVGFQGVKFVSSGCVQAVQAVLDHVAVGCIPIRASDLLASPFLNSAGLQHASPSTLTC